MTSNPTAPKRRPRQRAVPIRLLGGPQTPEAAALVEHILQDHVLPARNATLSKEGRKPSRPTSVAKMRHAIGALVADLLDLEADAGPTGTTSAGIHGTSPKDFDQRHLGFARSIFLQVTDHIEAAGLLRVTKGKPRWHPVFDTFVVRGGDMTTYRLTPKALTQAEEFGVLSDWQRHWRLIGDLPQPVSVNTPLLTLRTSRRRVKGKKQDAIDVPLDHGDRRVQEIVRGITALNDYLGAQSVGGMAFLGLRRIFNDGSAQGYGWNKGGRFYSLPGGHSYESWSSRKRRRGITINGEAVDEVDLRASHLTLLHALLRRSFDPREDPYDIPGWPRAVVKAWVSQAIGSGNARPTQWSERAQSDYEKERSGWLKDEFAIRQVGAAVKDRHPLLLDLKACGIGPLDLMYHEAEILRLAMEDLMLTQGIPVLPMHDALIAPRSALRQALEALEQAFASHVEGVTGHPSMVFPKVTWKGAEA